MKVRSIKYFGLMSGLRMIGVVLVFFMLAGDALAQYGFTEYLGDSPGGQFDINQFFNIINGLACYFVRFAIIVFGVMLIVYGLMFFKGRGSAQGMADSKKALTWGLVGGLVIFSVFTIILTVAGIVGVDYPVISRISC